jgi:hypothetical protein
MFHYRKKQVFIREKQSPYVAASVILQRYLKGYSIKIRALLHLQELELSSCGPLSIQQQHDHNSESSLDSSGLHQQEYSRKYGLAQNY